MKIIRFLLLLLLENICIMTQFQFKNHNNNDQ